MVAVDPVTVKIQHRSTTLTVPAAATILCTQQALLPTSAAIRSPHPAALSSPLPHTLVVGLADSSPRLSCQPQWRNPVRPSRRRVSPVHNACIAPGCTDGTSHSLRL